MEPLTYIDLIRLVQKHPLLYNKDLLANEDAINEAWNNIAKEVNQTVEFCKNKWDWVYKKYIKERAVKPVSKWKYFNDLDFLAEHVRRRGNAALDVTDDEPKTPEKGPSSSVTSQTPSALPVEQSTPLNIPLRQIKYEIQSDKDSEARLELPSVMQNNTTLDTIRDPNAHYFGLFVGHHLNHMEPNKRIRIILEITKMLEAAHLAPENE